MLCLEGVVQCNLVHAPVPREAVSVAEAAERWLGQVERVSRVPDGG